MWTSGKMWRADLAFAFMHLVQRTPPNICHGDLDSPAAMHICVGDAGIKSGYLILVVSSPGTIVCLFLIYFVLLSFLFFNSFYISFRICYYFQHLCL